MNVAMNKKGYDRFEEVLARGLKPIHVDELGAVIDISNTVLLDVRVAADFSKGFIPGSINIGLKGDFAPWVGALIVDVRTPIILVTSPGDEQEAVTRLARVGFDHVLGFVDGGFEAWKNSGKETDAVHRITASQFSHEFEAGKSVVLDVRKDSEYAAEHVDQAFSRPLASINEWFGKIGDEPFFLHCQGGYRSMIAASILKARGIHHFKEVDGGFKAIAETSVPKSDFVCQSKTVAS
jgi:rhodanese-related sulfurtransferase